MRAKINLINQPNISSSSTASVCRLAASLLFSWRTVLIGNVWPPEAKSGHSSNCGNCACEAVQVVLPLEGCGFDPNPCSWCSLYKALHICSPFTMCVSPIKLIGWGLTSGRGKGFVKRLYLWLWTAFPNHTVVWMFHMMQRTTTWVKSIYWRERGWEGKRKSLVIWCWLAVTFADPGWTFPSRCVYIMSYMRQAQINNRDLDWVPLTIHKFTNKFGSNSFLNI